MKIYILFLFLLFSGFGQSQNQINLFITDDLNIPLDSVECAVNFTDGNGKTFYSNNGKVAIDIFPFKKAMVEFGRRGDFQYLSKQVKFTADSIDSNRELIIKLIPSRAISHGFTSINLDGTFVTTEILNFPDTLSFFDSPIGFIQSGWPYVRLNTIDINTYYFNLVDPKRKIIVQGSDYNQKLTVDLLENDIINLTLNKFTKSYNLIGYKTFRGFEWKLIKR